MYGSDDVPVGVLRGKYIAFGCAWAYLSETNHTLNLSHCEPRMTFTRYEQLRAMRRAARRLGMTQQQNEALFHDTAVGLIESVRGLLARG
jgi:glutamate-1-semialdehyde 2,1-aminomutase